MLRGIWPHLQISSQQMSCCWNLCNQFWRLTWEACWHPGLLIFSCCQRQPRGGCHAVMIVVVVTIIEKWEYSSQLILKTSQMQYSCKEMRHLQGNGLKSSKNTFFPNIRWPDVDRQRSLFERVSHHLPTGVIVMYLWTYSPGHVLL